MTHTYSISGMTCNGCAATVEKALGKVAGVELVQVNLQQSSATITMTHHVGIEKLRAGLASFPTYQLSENGAHQIINTNLLPGFWSDSHLWKRASFNTLNCLVGCSIGDFGMILFLQYYYPGTSMTAQMILAIVAGLTTSVALETVLLKVREKFQWKFAFQTALSMSFLSMVGMEIAMNTTDFMITGGKAAFGNPMYWMALVVAMIAGFLAPLPYNYYKLKKFNKACH
jgi:copper chaperone CopZ